jgi:hypothetical protein
MMQMVMEEETTVVATAVVTNQPEAEIAMAAVLRGTIKIFRAGIEKTLVNKTLTIMVTVSLILYLLRSWKP